MGKIPTFEDVLGCQTALFEWTDSYDSKDWQRLRDCVAPTLQVSQHDSSFSLPLTPFLIDYSTIMDKKWDTLPADEFVAMVSNVHFLGNKRIKTQHFVGASSWSQTGETVVVGRHQLRVAHQRYADDACTEVSVKGHAHGTAVVTYQQVHGSWKFAGLVPNVRWSEFEYDQVFAPNEAALNGSG